MSAQIWWYLARASGMVAAALLLASLLLGVLLATRVLKPLDRPAWLLAMHRWLAGLAVGATLIHLGALVADGYVQFGAVELLVPFASSWRPLAVALGVVAFYLLVLVQVTSLMMRRLPKPVWRGIHYASYGLAWTAVVHGALAGTDVSNRVYQAVAMLLTVGVVAAAVLRVVVGRSRPAAKPARSPRRDDVTAELRSEAAAQGAAEAVRTV